jgi:choline dehydrogenase
MNVGFGTRVQHGAMRRQRGVRRLFKPDEEVDFVVVGAGSAGCAIAARLSEDPRTKVVLLEAGGSDRNIWIHIPIGYGRTMIDQRVNWMLQTEPDPNLGNRSIFWPRGKVLGGSSSINGLIYIRGQRQDFDTWRQMGNVGWSFDDVLPYFKRSEDQVRGASELHGTGGPLAVDDMRDRHPICEAFIRACADNGVPRNDDFNGREQEGVGYFQLTARNGRRCSAARGYLHPAMRRPNLHVVTHAHAERITFDGRRATGVVYRRGDRSFTVRARAEVVLCGGAIASPHLLMLSGVGPAAHLAEHGTGVVHDLPGVGQCLQDHYQARIALRCRFPITVNDMFASKLGMARYGPQYGLRRTGPLTIAAGQVGVFARTRPELATPDVQYHFILFSADRIADGLHKWPGFTLSVCQLRPESRGEIRLRSSDPLAAAAIHPNYLATETDRRTMVDGMKLGRRWLTHPDVAHFIESEYLPGAAVADDAAMLDFVRAQGTTIYHPTSTCRMGADDMAVTDAALRVHGLERLRVADASVMPTVVSGNTNAAAIMIGEKAADLLRGREALRAAA